MSQDINYRRKKTCTKICFFTQKSTQNLNTKKNYPYRLETCFPHYMTRELIQHAHSQHIRATIQILSSNTTTTPLNIIHR